MEKHFVTFFSPGTFADEATERPVDSWDIKAATEMAQTVLERHNATPYAFRFSTRTRGEDDLDSHVSAQSNIYYLGGRIETREEVEARNDPREKVLRDNMRINNIEKVIVNDNSWRTTRQFNDTDVILDFTPRARQAAE